MNKKIEEINDLQECIDAYHKYEKEIECAIKEEKQIRVEINSLEQRQEEILNKYPHLPHGGPTDGHWYLKRIAELYLQEIELKAISDKANRSEYEKLQ